MAIEAKDPSNEVDEKAAYVTVNGVEYAIVRAETWFDTVRTAWDSHAALAAEGRAVGALTTIAVERATFQGRP